MNTFISIITHGSWQSLIMAMVHTLWQAAVVAGLLWVLLRSLPSGLAATRYAISVLALIITLLLGLATWSALEHGDHQTAPFAANFPTIHPAGDGIVSAMDADVVQGLVSTPAAAPIHWTTIAGWTWLCGMLVMITRAAVGLARAQHRIAMGTLLEDGPVQMAIHDVARRLHLRRPIRVMVHEDWLIPAVAGFIWPTLLLPASMLTGWSAEEMEAVIAHELSHVRRFDSLVNFAQQVIEAVLFFNPCIWWISRQIRTEREACCDAVAVQITGNRAVAAGMLARFAQWSASNWQPQPVGLAITGTPPGSLLDRVKRILRPEDRPWVAAPWYTGIGAIAIAFAVLCLLHVSTDVAVKAAEQMMMSKQDVTKIADIQRSLQPAADDTSSGHEVTVHGIIRTSDGSPVPTDAYVGVMVQSGNNMTSYSAPIQADGTFSTKVQHGTVTKVFFNDSKNRYAPVSLGPLKPDADGNDAAIDITVDRGFDAPIRVVDPSGKPVAQARISSTFVMGSWLGEHNGQTDANGIYVIDHATSAVAAQVDVTANGYEYERISLPLVKGQTGIIQLTASKPTTGTVVDSITGAPIAGATIVLAYHAGFSPGNDWYPGNEYSKPNILAKTDARGRFTLDTLRSDSQYYLWVSAPDHGDEYIRNVLASQADLVWKLGPPRLIRGHITGDLSRLEKGSKGVVLHYTTTYEIFPGISYGAGDQTVPVSVVDGEGTFEIRNPKPGNFSFYPPNQGGVQVHADELEKVVEIHLDSLSDVAAKPKRLVVFKFGVPAGAPSPQGSLQVNQFNAVQNYFEAATDVPIVDGTAQLQMPIGGRLQYSGEKVAGYFIMPGRDISIPDGADPFQISIAATPAGAAAGRVLEPDGSGCRDFYVSMIEVKRSPLLPMNGSSSMQPYNPSGNAEPGGFLVSPLAMGGTYQLIARSVDRIASSPEFVIDAQTPLRQMNLQFPPGRSVVAKVVDATGQPRAGVQIGLDFSSRFGNGFGGSKKPTSRDGLLQWDHVNGDADGSYTLTVQPGNDFPGTSVPIKIDGSVVNITLDPGLSLNGQVIDDPTGEPIKSVEVKATCRTTSNSAVQTSVFTDADGRFSFRNLPRGTCWINIDSTAPAGTPFETLPNGKRKIHYPFALGQNTVEAGQKEDVILRVLRFDR